MFFFYRYARPTSTEKKKDERLKALTLHFQNNVIQFALE